MDWLDKMSITLIIALSILILGMVTKQSAYDHGRQERKKNDRDTIRAQKSDFDLKIYGEVKTNIEEGNYNKALEKLEKIMEEHPQKRESQLFKAKIYAQQGNMGDAISLYRQSIEKFPNLLELASVDLWDIVQKGLPKFHREKKLKPDDEKVKNLLRDLYFLQRKLGQGCE